MAYIGGPGTFPRASRQHLWETDEKLADRCGV